MSYTPPPAKQRGRPPGAVGKLAREAVEKAKASGILPHEFLLSLARGEIQSTQVMDPESGEITLKYEIPDLPMRVDAAKAAAPYYAPKLSTVELISGVADADLDVLIAQLAAQTGLSVGTDGEGKTGEAEDPAPRRRAKLNPPAVP